jgi:K+-sensing histidine kinase KdpD
LPEISHDTSLGALSEQSAKQVLDSGQIVTKPGIRLGTASGNGPVRRVTLVCVPVQARGKVVGSLCVFLDAPRRSDDHKVDLLSAIAHQVGVAVENAWLSDEASRAEIWRELNRLRSELIANVSHELRTPLGLIKLSCTSLLAEDVEFDAQIMRRFLKGIDEETDRLEGIVNHLLDLSQVDSGRLRLNRQPTDVTQLVRQVIASAEMQADGHRIVYNFVEPLTARVDRQRLEQVLRNLLDNAIKYSPRGGAVLVQGYEDKGQLFIQVSDEGVGIPAEDLDRIFERFYRVENESTLDIGGVGLGLAVCKSLVEAHGGRIWVESDAGLGSTFHIALPVGATHRLPVDQAHVEAAVLQDSP